jgi:hypothetical protein
VFCFLLTEAVKFFDCTPSRKIESSKLLHVEEWMVEEVKVVSMAARAPPYLPTLL